LTGTNWRLKFYSEKPDWANVITKKCKYNFPFSAKHTKFSETFFLCENIPTPERVKAFKWIALLQCFLETEHNIIFFNTCHQYEAFHVVKRKAHVSAIFPQTTENMALLNVEYSTLIITVLQVTDSNLTFIFDLNCFLWGKFLA